MHVFTSSFMLVMRRRWWRHKTFHAFLPWSAATSSCTFFFFVLSFPLLHMWRHETSHPSFPRLTVTSPIIRFFLFSFTFAFFGFLNKFHFDHVVFMFNSAFTLFTEVKVSKLSTFVSNTKDGLNSTTVTLNIMLNFLGILLNNKFFFFNFTFDFVGDTGNKGLESFINKF